MNREKWMVLGGTLVALALGIFTQGCRMGSPPTEAALPGGAEGTAQSGSTTEALSNYQIGPGDTLVIEVLGEDTLKKEARVGSDGTISYYYLGNLSVAGKTADQVEQMIAKGLKGNYLNDPQVSVNIKEFRLQTISVIGQVQKPGVVPLPVDQPYNVIEAIAAAGGLTDKASKNRIEVIRNGKHYHFSLDELMLKTDTQGQFLLQPGDVVNVHESII